MTTTKAIVSRVVGSVAVIAIIVGVKIGYRAYQGRPQVALQRISFAQARLEHSAKLVVSERHGTGALPRLYHDELEYTAFEGPLGTMGAIASKAAPAGSMKPAVIWVTGGFGGLFEGVDQFGDPENDQGIASFLDRGIMVFLPTLRGEHESPGVFECFYGEIDDLVAAVEHVAARADVDPDRIYLMGHSIGGTNVLLASLLTDIPAGVVSFGGAPDMSAVVSNGRGYGVEPYDMDDPTEVMLRSAIRFTKDIQCPVLYIEGAETPGYIDAARRMDGIAREVGVDFEAAIVHDANHFSVLRPMKDLLAERIQSGMVGLPSAGEVQDTVDGFFARPEYLLIKAAQAGDASGVRRVIDSGVDVDAVDDDGSTAFMLAAELNADAEVLAALAGAGADVDAKDSIGETALIKASIHLPENIKPLLGLGADVNIRDDEGAIALMYAVSNTSDLDPIQALIDAGSEINAQDSDGFSVLMYASVNASNPEIISLLVSSGADVDARDDRGLTVLMNAVIFSESPPVVESLIREGAYREGRNPDGATALMFAAQYSSEPMIQTLLDAGADPKSTDYGGYGVLAYADLNEQIVGTAFYEVLLDASKPLIP